MKTKESVISALIVGLGGTTGILIGQYFTGTPIIEGGGILTFFILMTLFYFVSIHVLNLDPF